MKLLIKMLQNLFITESDVIEESDVIAEAKMKKLLSMAEDISFSQMARSQVASINNYSF